MRISSENQTPVICLMGPTAVGKTPLAIELVKHFPCEIISVDSAQVYRGMDIGTAKPTPALLKLAPHRLIDILDPKTPYSAGQFRQDVIIQIREIVAQGKIPLLVGGTMLYFRVLQNGLAHLPPADQVVRKQLDQQMVSEGIQSLYDQLMTIDPVSAKRIHKHDAQRIKRALEVYRVTAKPISEMQASETITIENFMFHNLVLMPTDRKKLHARIAQRFQQMLVQGFVDEVQQLFQRQDLHADLPSIRSVGYRQAWQYLTGQLSYELMCEQSICATRQLAKRQITWLRRFPASVYFDSDDASVALKVKNAINICVDYD